MIIKQTNNKSFSYYMGNDNKKNQTLYIMYGVVFTVIAIVALIALVRMRSQADDASQTTDITNASPTVNSVTIGMSSGAGPEDISLVENTTTNVYIHGTATDNNGCEEIDDVATNSEWEVVLYRSDI